MKFYNFFSHSATVALMCDMRTFNKFKIGKGVQGVAYRYRPKTVVSTSLASTHDERLKIRNIVCEF